jgi:hypothetical protein
MNATQFIHTCTISTPGASISRDKDNQPIPGVAVVLSAVGCRYGDLSAREIANLVQAGLTEVAAYLYVGRTATIAQGSRVSAITHRLSGVLEQAGPFEVKSIVKRRAGGVEYQYCILGKVA